MGYEVGGPPYVIPGDVLIVNSTIINTTQIGDDVTRTSALVDPLNLYADIVIGTTVADHDRDVSIFSQAMALELTADGNFIIDGTTKPNTTTTGLLNIDLTTLTNDGVNALNILVTTHNLGAGEWAMGLRATVDATLALTATSNVAGIYLDTPTDPGATVVTYGMYIEAGWDFGFASLSPIMLSSLTLAPAADPTPYPLDFQLEGFGVPGTGTVGVYTEGRVINSEYGDARAMTAGLHFMYVDMATNLTQAGFNLVGMEFFLDTTGEANAGILLSSSKDITNTTGGTLAMTNPVIDLNVILTNSVALSVVSWDNYFIDMDYSASQADAASTFSGGFLAMTITETLGTVSLQGDMVSLTLAGTIPAGQTLRGMYLNGDGVAAGAGEIFYGLNIELDGMTTGGTIYGIYLQLRGAGMSGVVIDNSEPNANHTSNGLTMTEVGNGATGSFTSTGDLLSITRTFTQTAAFTQGVSSDVISISEVLTQDGAGNLTHTGSFINIAITPTAGPYVSGSKISQTYGAVTVDDGLTLTGYYLSASPTMGVAASATFRGVDLDINETGAGINASVITGYHAIITGVTSGLSDLIGFHLEMDGTKDQGDAHSGMLLDLGMTINNAAEILFGIDIALNSMTVGAAGTSVLYGLRVAMDTMTLTGVPTTMAAIQLDLARTGFGIRILGDQTDAANSVDSILVSHDLEGAITADRTNSGTMLQLSSFVDNTSAGDWDVTNSMDGLSILMDHAVGVAVGAKTDSDTFSGTAIDIAIGGTTGASAEDKLLNTARAIDINYMMDEGTGALTIDDFSIIEIDYDTSGSPQYQAGDFNMLAIFADDAGVPDWSGAATFNGVLVNIDGIDVTDAQLTLQGLYILMPPGIATSTVVGAQVDMGPSGSGIRVMADQADLANAVDGILVSHDLAAVITGDRTNSGQMLELSSVVTNSTAGDFDITNSVDGLLITMSHTMAVTTGAKAAPDTFSGTAFRIDIDATTGADAEDDLTSTARAVNIDYTLTEGTGTLDMTAFNVMEIDFDTVGTPSYAAGTYQLIGINGTDAGVPAYAASVTFNAIGVDLSGMDVSDGDLSLYGLNVAMPAAYGASAEAAIRATGAGNVVEVLNDTVGLYMNILDATTLATVIDLDLEVFPTGNVIVMDYSVAEALSGALTGINMDFSTNITMGANVVTGVLMDISSADDGNAAVGLNVTKDGGGAITADRAISGNMITLANAVTNTSGGDFDVTNTSNGISLTMSHNVNSGQVSTDPDTFSGTALFLDIDITTTQANDTLTHTFKGVDINYTMTQTAGGLTPNAFNVVEIDFDTVGNPTYVAGNYFLLAINANDAGTPIYNATTSIFGINLDMSGMNVTGGDQALRGLNIAMPTSYGTSVEMALQMSGGGNTILMLGNNAGISMNVLTTEVTTPLNFDLEVFPTGTVINADYSVAETLTGAMVGVDLDFATNLTHSGQTVTAFTTNISTTDEANSSVGFSATKNYATSAGLSGNVAFTGNMITLASAISHTDPNDFDVDNSSIGISLTMSHTMNQAAAPMKSDTDTFSGTGILIDIDASTTDVIGDILAMTQRGIDIQYTASYVGGLFNLNSTDIFRIDFNVAASVVINSVGVGNLNMILLDGDGFVPGANVTNATDISALMIDWSSASVNDAQASLYGVKVLMPTATHATAAAVAAIFIDPGLNGRGIFIDAATVDGTIARDLIFVDVDLADIGANTFRGVNVNIDETVVGTNAAVFTGYGVTLSGFGTGLADLIGFEAVFDTTKSGGDLSVGLRVDSNITLNNAAEIFYGTHLDLDGMTITDASIVAALRIDLAMTTPDNSDYMAGIRVNVPGGRTIAIDTNVRGTISGRVEEGADHFHDGMSGGELHPVWTNRVVGAGTIATADRIGGWVTYTSAAVAADETSSDWDDDFNYESESRPTFEITVDLAQVDNDTEVYIGLVDTNVAATYDGSAGSMIMFQIDFGDFATTNWNLRASNDGATTTDAGAAASTNNVILRFEYISDTTVEWFIDGTSQGTVTTNVPAADALQPVISIRSAGGGGGGAKAMDIARVDIWQDRQS